MGTGRGETLRLRRHEVCSPLFLAFLPHFSPLLLLSPLPLLSPLLEEPRIVLPLNLTLPLPLYNVYHRGGLESWHDDRPMAVLSRKYI